MREISSGQFVIPGEKLGVIEEFIPDVGTYVKDGNIYSSSMGFVLIDFINKKISVYPATHNVSIPRVGSIVTGYVTTVQNAFALVRIFRVGRKILSGSFTGVIHISDISRRYIDNIYDAVRLGDIVRAKVISDKNKIFHLTIKDENLGVIYAFCSQCGGNLIKRRNLKCAVCGNTEKRKISVDYGKVII